MIEIREIPPETLDLYAGSEPEPAETRMVNRGTWPGARRRTYLFVTSLLPLSIMVTIGLASHFLIARFGEEILMRLALGMVILPISFIICCAFRRLDNLGMSRWWIIGYLIPPLSFWVGYRCFACPAGYVSHKKMDGVGIFLAIIYWLINRLVLLLVSVGVGLGMGAIGSPEAQQQFQNALHAPPATQP